MCSANEIRDYQKSLTKNFGLYDHISFNTGVKKASWDQVTFKWNIETDTNETLQVTHLISGCGVLRTPHIPEFKEQYMHFLMIFYYQILTILEKTFLYVLTSKIHIIYKITG